MLRKTTVAMFLSLIFSGCASVPNNATNSNQPSLLDQTGGFIKNFTKEVMTGVMDGTAARNLCNEGKREYCRNRQTTVASSSSVNQSMPTLDGTPIQNTELNGFFQNNPWNGGSSSFPKVALTVTDWNARCWKMDAVIWSSSKHSRHVNDVVMCLQSRSLGAIGSTAVSYQMMQSQVQVFDHTGQVRTTGPKPPQTPFPSISPNLDSYGDFLTELAITTQFQGGSPDTRIWIVRFDKKS